jgi:hypothetical protein
MSSVKQAAVEVVVKVVVYNASARLGAVVASDVKDRPEVSLPLHLLPEGFTIVGIRLLTKRNAIEPLSITLHIELEACRELHQGFASNGRHFVCNNMDSR